MKRADQILPEVYGTTLNTHNPMSEWLLYAKQEQVTFHYDVVYVSYVLDQHTELGFYCASYHRLRSDDVYSIQHYVIKFVIDLRHVFSGTPVSSTNKTDCHDITEILLKVVLNNITVTL